MDSLAGSEYADILDRIGDPVFALDCEWRLTYTNAEAEKLFGRPQGELIGESIEDVSRQTVGITLYRALRGITGESTTSEHFLPTIGRWLEIRPYPSDTGITVYLHDITERKLAEEEIEPATLRAERTDCRTAEEELRESRARLGALYAATFEGVVVHEGGIILEANDSFARMFGYKRAEVIGVCFLDLVAPESQDLVMQHAEEGYPEPYEIIGLRRDGTTFFAELHGKSITYMGRPVRAGAVRDITERKRAEQVLARYQVLSKHARDIFLFIRPDGSIVEANDAAVRAYGYSRDELLSMNVLDLRTPETAAQTAGQMEQARTGGALFETVHRRKDGSTFPVEVSSTAAIIGGEQVLLSVVRDITERKKDEQALREREEEYKTLAENSPEVIARFDRNLRHTYVNDYGARVYGLPKEEVIGRTNADLGMPPDKVAYWKEHFEQVFATGKQQTVDFDFVGPTFGHQYFSSIFVPELNGKGEVESVLAITRDVTALHEAESALRESEERFRSAVEGLLDAFAIMRPIRDESGKVTDFRMEYANRVALEYADRSADEFIGRLNSELFPLTERLGLLEKWVHVADTGEPLSLDSFPFVEHLGRYEPGVYLDIRVTRAKGNLIFAWRDVTERVLAEKSLEAERARLRTVLDTIPVGVVIADANGRMVEMNEQLRETWGADAPRSEGVDEYSEYKGWWPDTGERIKSEDWALARALTKGEVSIGEVIEIERFDGGRRTILNNAAPMRDAQGRITGAVVTVQDITEMENLRRQIQEALDREKHFSLLLQRALLPPLPAISDGYEVAVEYRPAFRGREIGGDFYDVFRTRDGCLGMLIGDVSGKGLESASIATATRSTIRAFAYETSSAAESLTRANTVMYGQIEPGLFVTIFLAVLEPRTGHMEYAGAGHPPAVLLHADGGVELLKIGLPPIAVVDGLKYADHEAYLHPGDRFVTYTDGISEARHDNMLFGIEGIESSLKAHAELPAKDLASALIADACHWAGEKLTDDAAIVLVERRE